jgi:Baseplate hub gp41
MAFVERALSFIFTRADGTSFPNGAKSITLPPGLMAQVRITNAGMPGMGGCQTSIYGLTTDVMNQLNTMGIRITLQPLNYVKIIAMDANGANTSTAFFGGIRFVAPDYNRQPDPCLSFLAMAGIETTGTQPIAQGYDGGVDVVQVLQDICTYIKNTTGQTYTLETNGVSGVSITHYSWGDPRSVVAEIRAQIIGRGYDVEFDIQSQTIAIWNTQKARNNPGGVPLVSAGDVNAPGNLIGYPTYTEFGIDFRCIYIPTLRLGGLVQVKSSLPTATALWYINSVSHALDTQMAGGKWETLVQASRVGAPQPVIVPRPA